MQDNYTFSPVSPSFLKGERSRSHNFIPSAFEAEQNARISKRSRNTGLQETLTHAEKFTAPLASANLNSKALLSNVSKIDAHEEYSQDEQLLNDFIKLHPMLR
jgi:hypothetical protein